MSEPALDPSAQPTLVGAVEAEQATTNPPCGAVQADAPDNVCVRDPHDEHGPHVASHTDSDGSTYFVQWEV